MPIIQKYRIATLSAQLNQTFRISLGSHEDLKNLSITLTLDNGVRGLGEAAVATHITGISFAATRRDLREAGEMSAGCPITSYRKLSKQLHERFAHNTAVIGALETALLDALTRHKKIPLWRFFGSTARPLRSDITIVLSDLRETRASIKRFYRQGFRIFKVKIGNDLDRDIKRLMILHDIAPRCPIIVDANQGYTPAEMIRFVKELRRHKVRLDLLEQPVPREDWEGLKEIGRSVRVPVCADESARSLADVRRIVKHQLCPAVNIKVMKCGLLDAQRITRLCHKNGITLMIGGMMETSIAMMASAHLASGMGGFKYVDLDTQYFIRGALERNPYVSSDGRYDLRQVESGVGVTRDQLYD